MYQHLLENFEYGLCDDRDLIPLLICIKYLYNTSHNQKFIDKINEITEDYRSQEQLQLLDLFFSYLNHNRQSLWSSCHLTDISNVYANNLHYCSLEEGAILLKLHYYYVEDEHIFFYLPDLDAFLYDADRDALKREKKRSDTTNKTDLNNLCTAMKTREITDFDVVTFLSLTQSNSLLLTTRNEQQKDADDSIYNGL